MVEPITRVTVNWQTIHNTLGFVLTYIAAIILMDITHNPFYYGLLIVWGILVKCGVQNR